MTKSEQQKTLTEIRDMCRDPEFEVISNHLYSKKDELERIYEWLEKTGNFDYYYSEHLGNKNGYELAHNPEKLTFKECCTALTFLLRAEHWSEGAFFDALSDGDVYKLLSRMVETI